MTVYEYTAINMQTGKLEHFATNADYTIGNYYIIGGHTARQPKPVEYCIVYKEIKYQL